MAQYAGCVLIAWLAASSQDEIGPQTVVKLKEGVSALAIPSDAADTAAIGTGAVWFYRKGAITKLEQLDRGAQPSGMKVEKICFAPTGGRWLASSEFAWATLWDLEKGREIGSISLPDKHRPMVFPYAKNGELAFFIGGQNAAQHNEMPSLYRLRVEEWDKIATLQHGFNPKSKKDAQELMLSHALPEAGSVFSIVEQPGTDSIIIVGSSFSDPRSLATRERIQKPSVGPRSCWGGDLEVLSRKRGGARSFISSLRLGEKKLAFEYWYRADEWPVGAVSESNGEILSYVVPVEGDRTLRCERLRLDEQKHRVEASAIWSRRLNEKEQAEIHGNVVVLRSPGKLELLRASSGKKIGTVQVERRYWDITSCAVDERAKTIWIGLDSGEVARAVLPQWEK